MAATYETDPRWEKLMAQLIAEVKDRRDFIGVDWVKDGESGRTVRMIDYACGPGTISRVSCMKPAGKGAKYGSDAYFKRVPESAYTKVFSIQALYPYVTQCRGIDLSTNMVTQYKARARIEVSFIPPLLFLSLSLL